ncbi:hypothetical protein [Nonomuraea sp. NPDC049784]|uniref:hypothetical protein n=1 Tax=Nonomuraea sp. NPDC049784 TaxID=3154361 RepID=UPI0033F54243
MRIHVLRLPLVEMGGIHEEPFALIADQFHGDAACQQTLMAFAEQAGARALWVTVEIVEPPVPAVLDTVALDDDHLEY